MPGSIVRRTWLSMNLNSRHLLPVRPGREVVPPGGNGACVGNQETLHDDVRIHMADPENAEKMFHFKDADKDHGRIEIREAAVCHDVDAVRDLHHWPGLQAVGKVTATREIKGERSAETRFFLLSERLDRERFLQTVRSHWAVENSLHWVLCQCRVNTAQKRRSKNAQLRG